jgi:hypothetical protein
MFVIDDDDDKLASAPAKLAEPVGLLRPVMHPPTAAISWLRCFLDGAGKNLPPGDVLNRSAELTSYPQSPRTTPEK